MSKLLVYLLVTLGGAIGALAVILPVNDHLDPEIVDCDIVTGELLVSSAVVLLTAIAVMLVRTKYLQREFQWPACMLASLLLLGLTTKLPEWRREAARARACP